MNTDDQGNASLSLYKDGPLQEPTFLSGKEMLKIRFKDFNEAMAAILLDLLIEENFTNQRFMDAIKSVNKTHEYPSFAPALILSYDKKLNLRTYEQVSKEQKEFGNTIWNYYKPVDIKGSCFYVHIRELEKYDIELPEYKPKSTTGKTNYHGEYKDGLKIPKPTFSVVEEFNKIARERGIEEI